MGLFSPGGTAAFAAAASSVAAAVAAVVVRGRTWNRGTIKSVIATIDIASNFFFVLFRNSAQEKRFVF